MRTFQIEMFFQQGTFHREQILQRVAQSAPVSDRTAAIAAVESPKHGASPCRHSRVQCNATQPESGLLSVFGGNTHLTLSSAHAISQHAGVETAVAAVAGIDRKANDAEVLENTMWMMK